MNLVKIELAEMETLLSPEKGWKRVERYNEHIFEFHLKDYPIVIRLGSTIRVSDSLPRNRNSNVIRIFAAQKEGMEETAKITNGLVRPMNVNRMEGWQQRVVLIVKVVMDHAIRAYLKRDKVS